MSEKNPTPIENFKGESAAVPPPEEPTPTPEPQKDEDTTFVVPEGLPFWCTALNLPQEDGSTLVIDREGASVPTADLEALRDQAANSGVALTTPGSE
jgi:hypothetical protein